MDKLKIIINEMKKIFSLKMVCLLLLGSAIIYEIFISFEIDYFPNGRPVLDEYNIGTQMIYDYGHGMDEREFEDFKNIYEEKLKEVDQFLSSNQDFNEVGVYSYKDYKEVQERSFFEETNHAFEEVKWDYLGRDEGTIFWELQTIPNMIELYEERNNVDLMGFERQKYEKRINEIIEHNENQSILPYMVFNNYNNIIKYFGACIVIGIAFMLTPLFLRDRKDKVEYLQYSSEHGRVLYKSKLIAGLISAFIIATVELVICFMLYRSNNTSMFFGSNINSAFNTSFWFNLTFLQYIILTVVSIYIISIITAFISMFVSGKVHSYITGIGVQVPTLFILCGLTEGVLLNYMFSMSMPKYLVFAIYVVLIIITVAIMVGAIRKERIADVANMS